MFIILVTIVTTLFSYFEIPLDPIDGIIMIFVACTFDITIIRRLAKE